MFRIIAQNPELRRLNSHSIMMKTALLRNHFEKIEKVFQEESENLYMECQLEDARTSNHEDDEQHDYRASDSLLEIEFIYLRMHRYSAILTAYSYLESSMNKLCETLQKEKNIMTPISERSGAGINRCKKYLKEFASINFKAISRTWGDLALLNKVRNCIMHAGGDVNRTKDNCGILSAIKIGHDLSFIEENLLMISGDYVTKSINNIETTLLYLADAIHPIQKQ